MEKEEKRNIKEFQCEMCGNRYKYKKFSKFKNEKVNLYLLEDVFYIDDPFQLKSAMPFIVGGRCSICSRTICVGQKCSIFYTKRFCLGCAKEDMKHFPKELHKEITPSFKT